MKRPPFYAERGPYSAREYRPGGSDEMRLWKRVRIEGPNDCWLWMGAKGRTGYGQFPGTDMYKGSPMPAHRVMYGVAFGRVPRGLSVMHTCDNPPCCNPFHLKLGTHTDNMRDMQRKGRGPDRTRTVCKWGHPREPRGGVCRTCARLRMRQLVLAKQELANQMREEFKVECLLPIVAPDFSGLKEQIAAGEMASRQDGRGKAGDNHRRAIAIVEFFGLYGRPHRTLESIAADWNVTRERVRQIRNIGLNYLGLDHNAVMFDLKYRLRFRDAIVARRKNDGEAAA